MPLTVNWNAQADIGNGNWSGQNLADAVDRIGRTLEAGDTATLALQPSGPSAIRFVVVSAGTYDGVTFALNAHAPVPLTGPAVFNEGAVRLLGAEAPMTLGVNNAGAVPVTVDIAVFRDP